MLDQTKNEIDHEIALMLSEFKENPFKTFNLAFIFSVLVSFLVIFYLSLTEIIVYRIPVLRVSVFFSVSVIIIAIGYCVSYVLVRKIIAKTIAYALLAKRSDKVKTEVMRAVTHELNNPLSTISMGLSNMRDGLFGKVSDDQEDALSLCWNVADRMKKLTKILLDSYKMEAGKIELNKERVDIIKLANRQIDELRHMMDDKNIRFVSEMPKSLVTTIDEEKIELVMNNLLSNAIKYTPDSGDIILRIFKDAGDLHIEVEDTGEGIPADRLPHIFKKFERVKNDDLGTGLGLAIAKHIVDIHNGKIFVDSAVGKGSKFTVILPTQK
jgi:signal transduction histidine kinase